MTFLAPPAILAAAGLVFGLWPAGLDNALDTYADTVPGGADYELALWHGLGLPLLLSVLVLAIGAAFFGRSRRRARGCTCRWATPTASTTPSIRGPTCCRVG